MKGFRAHYAPRIPTKGVDQSLVRKRQRRGRSLEPGGTLQEQQAKRGLKNDVDGLHHANHGWHDRRG